MLRSTRTRRAVALRSLMELIPPRVTPPAVDAARGHLRFRRQRTLRCGWLEHVTACRRCRGRWRITSSHAASARPGNLLEACDRIARRRVPPDSRHASSSERLKCSEQPGPSCSLGIVRSAAKRHSVSGWIPKCSAASRVVNHGLSSGDRTARRACTRAATRSASMSTSSSTTECTSRSLTGLSLLPGGCSPLRARRDRPGIAAFAGSSQEPETGLEPVTPCLQDAG